MFQFINLLGVIPPSERPAPNAIINNLVYRSYNRLCVEPYLYLKAYIVILVLNIVLFGAFLTSYILKSNFDIAIFKISYYDKLPLYSILHDYPRHVFPLLSALSLIYVLVLFLLHTDYFTKDRWRRSPENRFHKGDVIPPLTTTHYLAIVVFCAVSTYFADAIPQVLSSYRLFSSVPSYGSDSLRGFIAFGIAYIFLFQTVLGAMNYAFINLVRDLLGNLIYKHSGGYTDE